MKFDSNIKNINLIASNLSRQLLRVKITKGKHFFSEEPYGIDNIGDINRIMEKMITASREMSTTAFWASKSMSKYYFGSSVTLENSAK